MFDPPAVEYVNEDYQSVANSAFKLTEGDVERFQIWAYGTGDQLIEWTLALPIVVNGSRQTISVDGPMDLSFATVGHEHGVTKVFSHGQGWRSGHE